MMVSSATSTGFSSGGPPVPSSSRSARMAISADIGARFLSGSLASAQAGAEEDLESAALVGHSGEVFRHEVQVCLRPPRNHECLLHDERLSLLIQRRALGGVRGDLSLAELIGERG